MTPETAMNPVYGYLAATAPELILFGGALLILLVDFIVPSQRDRFPILAAATALIALRYALFTLEGPHAPAFAGALAVDAWTAVFRVLVCGVAAFAALLALPRGRLAPPSPLDPGARGVHGGDAAILILVSAAGMSLMAASRDYIVTLLAMEIMSLAIYPLIALARTRHGFEAATKYFLMGAVGSAVMLLGISFLYGVTGTTRYVPLQPLEGRALLGFVLVLTGFLFKLAAVPFHAWLLDAYEAAPASLGAFMAAGVKAAAAAGAGRFLFLVLFPQSSATPEVVRSLIAISAATLFLGNAGALFQSNIARLLGYSAIAHTGFLLMGLAASAQTGNPFGLSSLVFYVATYAPAAVGAFAVVGLAESASADRAYPLSTGVRDLGLLKGLWRHHPWTAAAFTVCIASLAGLPPTAGFWGKLEIFRAGFQAGQIGLLAIAILNSLLAAYYYIKLVKSAFTDEPARLIPGDPARSGVALAAAAIVLGMGLLPGGFLLAAFQAALRLAG